MEDKKDRKALWIAQRLGKQAGGGFREALADLVHVGAIIKGAGGWGYALAPKPSTPMNENPSPERSL